MEKNKKGQGMVVKNIKKRGVSGGPSSGKDFWRGGSLKKRKSPGFAGTF